MDVNSFWDEHHDEENRIVWPTDEPSKTALARRLIGAALVSKLDSWTAWADDALRAPQPASPYERPWSEHARRDRERRSGLEALDDDQREAVALLVREACEGLLHSVLVTLDQFPGADVNVEVALISDEDSLSPYRVRVGPSDDSLHDDLFGWIERFSKRAP